MMSAFDVPACPACGSREVHPVTTPVADRREAVGRDDPIRHPDDVITATIRTFYACRGCGRDQTDAWAPLQKRLARLDNPGTLNTVIGPPDPPDPLGLGVGATIKATT